MNIISTGTLGASAFGSMDKVDVDAIPLHLREKYSALFHKLDRDHRYGLLP